MFLLVLELTLPSHLSGRIVVILKKDVVVVVRQMLQVATECHLHGLVHQDMIETRGMVKLASISVQYGGMVNFSKNVLIIIFVSFLSFIAFKIFMEP